VPHQELRRGRAVSVLFEDTSLTRRDLKIRWPRKL
jgi:hypothetical protein